MRGKGNIAKLLVPRRRGGCSSSNEEFHLLEVEQPPRLRRLWMLRFLFLLCADTPPGQEGRSPKLDTFSARKRDTTLRHPETAKRWRHDGSFFGRIDLWNPVIREPIPSINRVCRLRAREQREHVFPHDLAFLRDLE